MRFNMVKEKRTYLYIFLIQKEKDKNKSMLPKQVGEDPSESIRILEGGT